MHFLLLYIQFRLIIKDTKKERKPYKNPTLEGTL